MIPALLECGSSSARLSLAPFSGVVVSLHNENCTHHSTSLPSTISLPFDQNSHCALTQHGTDMVTVVELRESTSILTIDDVSFLIRCPMNPNLPERIPRIPLTTATLSSSTGDELLKNEKTELLLTVDEDTRMRPYECTVFSGRDKLQLMPLTDTSGCALSSSMTSFSISSSSPLSFSSSFHPPSISNLSSFFIQCSLRPCVDPQCSMSCDRPSTVHSSLLVTARFTLVSSLPSPVERQLDSRLLLIPILLVSSILSLSFAFFARSDIPSVQDIRSLIDGKLATRRSESKRSTVMERSSPSPTTPRNEFLAVNELIHAHDRSFMLHSPYILSASVMDSLPEPPYYAAAQLGIPQLELPPCPPSVSNESEDEKEEEEEVYEAPTLHVPSPDQSLHGDLDEIDPSATLDVPSTQRIVDSLREIRARSNLHLSAHTSVVI